MASSNQVVVLQKDVQELEQMNGSLLDRLAQLERELESARVQASQAEAQNKVVCLERDELRRELAAVSETRCQPTHVAPSQDDLHKALLEIERFEALLRTETEQRVELESRLALRQKLDVENGLAHQLEVTELERMNSFLASENTALQEKLNKAQSASQQVQPFYKAEMSTEPCAEPEQDEFRS